MPAISRTRRKRCPSMWMRAIARRACASISTGGSKRRRRGGTDRLGFVSPEGGTISAVDPVALLRGAKNRAVALAFIDWVVSLDAQKLWGFKPGTPGGPQRYNLRRMPVRRDFYVHEDWKPFRSDPEVSPFAEKNQLIYHAAW